VQNSGKKDAIITDVKKVKNSESQRRQMVYAYYSMPISAVFLSEGCLASLIRQAGTVPVSVDDLFAKSEALHDVFKLEHFYEYPVKRDNVRDRLCFFREENLLQLNEDESMVSVVKSPTADKMLRFFAELTESFVDTYLITLLTIDVINGKPMFLSVRKLI
jgi:hypothetical protein